LTQPIIVANRPGGSGAIGLSYVAKQKGNPHYWLNATLSILTTPLKGLSKYTYKDFTPIATLAFDEFFICVRADSPYRNMKELIEAAQKNPGQLKFGGTYSAPGADAVVAFLIEKATGAKFNYIPFTSGGRVLMALLGGHVDAGVNEGSSVVGQSANFPPNSIRILEGQLSKSPLSFAVRYDSPDLLSWLNLFFLHISLDGRLEKNLNYWVNSLDGKKDH